MYLTPSHRKLLWLDRCTSRLMELQPRLSVDSAWSRAEALHAKSEHTVPEHAAETFHGETEAEHPFGLFRAWMRTSAFGQAARGRG